MLRRGPVTVVVGVVLLACSAVAAPAGAAEGSRELKEPVPFYMQSKEIRKRIARAGAKGVSYRRIQKWVRMGLAGKKNREEPVVEPCPTAEPFTESGSVHTNACITYPAGCTANFIYKRGSSPAAPVSDGRSYFLGTAGHCVDHSGQPVYADNGAGAMIKVGPVWKKVNGGIGNDMAAVRIDASHRIDPKMPFVANAPEGVYSGCAGGQSLTWWGHGYGVVVGQGNPGIGAGARWWDRPYGWVGDALPGDSGSGVVLADGSRQAAGNLTHLVVDPAYFGVVNVGTRLTHYLAWLGGDIHLVNWDRSTSTAPRNTGCGNPNYGNG